jgi:hypothetical protein
MASGVPMNSGNDWIQPLEFPYRAKELRGRTRSQCQRPRRQPANAAKSAIDSACGLQAQGARKERRKQRQKLKWLGKNAEKVTPNRCDVHHATYPAVTSTDLYPSSSPSSYFYLNIIISIILSLLLQFALALTNNLQFNTIACSTGDSSRPMCR